MSIYGRSFRALWARGEKRERRLNIDFGSGFKTSLASRRGEKEEAAPAAEYRFIDEVSEHGRARRRGRRGKARQGV
jgi:hypothetical protein